MFKSREYESNTYTTFKCFQSHSLVDLKDGVIQGTSASGCFEPGSLIHTECCSEADGDVDSVD